MTNVVKTSVTSALVGSVKASKSVWMAEEEEEEEEEEELEQRNTALKNVSFGTYINLGYMHESQELLRIVHPICVIDPDLGYQFYKLSQTPLQVTIDFIPPLPQISFCQSLVLAQRSSFSPSLPFDLANSPSKPVDGSFAFV
jgi:hypothetical protein